MKALMPLSIAEETRLAQCERTPGGAGGRPGPLHGRGGAYPVVPAQLHHGLGGVVPLRGDGQRAETGA